MHLSSLFPVALFTVSTVCFPLNHVQPRDANEVNLDLLNVHQWLNSQIDVINKNQPDSEVFAPFLNILLFTNQAKGHADATLTFPAGSIGSNMITRTVEKLPYWGLIAVVHSKKGRFLSKANLKTRLRNELQGLKDRSFPMLSAVQAKVRSQEEKNRVGNVRNRLDKELDGAVALFK